MVVLIGAVPRPRRQKAPGKFVRLDELTIPALLLALAAMPAPLLSV